MEIYPAIYQTSQGTPRDLGSLLSLRSQGFGENYQYYHDHLGTNGHAGMDWPCTIGTQLYAPIEGTVSYVSVDYTVGGGHGAGVILDTIEGECLVWHFSRVDVKVGDYVKLGQKIGLSGNSGFSTGPHVHLEWRPTPLAYSNGFFGAVDFIALMQWRPQPKEAEAMTQEEVERLQILEGYHDPIGIAYWTGKPLAEYLKARLTDKRNDINAALT